MENKELHLKIKKKIKVIKGLNGEPGIQGIEGPAGPVGPTGPTGEKGLPGLTTTKIITEPLSDAIVEEINANTAHRLDTDLHFDDLKQKKYVLDNIGKNTTVYQTGGGAVDTLKTITAYIPKNGSSWANDKVSFFLFKKRAVLDSISYVAIGSSSPVLNFALKQSTDPNSSGTLIHNYSADVDSQKELLKQGIAADTYLIYSTGSSPDTGTVTALIITITYN